MVESARARIVVSTENAEETIALGERLGALLGVGDVVALTGDLGAGKTTLVKGIAAGMGITADICSPTFTLIREHSGEVPLYHVDLYRLSGIVEVDTIGVEEYIYGSGVTIIEWADRMQSLLPAERLDVELRIEGETRRRIVLTTRSPRLRAAIEGLGRDADTGD